MNTFFIRTILFIAVLGLLFSAGIIDTNSSQFAGKNLVPPPTIKYVTPHGTGSHSGVSWDSAYSLIDMIDKLASSTIYYLTDSVFLVDSIIISNFNHLSVIGQVPDVTILEGIDTSEIEDTSNWSKKCFDLDDADNVTISNLQIRRFRGFGIKVNSESDYFKGYNLYIDSCGWTAWGTQSGPPVMEIPSPCGVKLFGDNAIFRHSYVMESGWDGIQVAGYGVLIDTTTIYWTGKDEPGATHQGDGIQAFKNPDIYYIIMPSPPDTIWKSGQFTVRKCTVNTVENKKSGIEAGYKDEDTEKPLVQIFNSVITGGKGIGITQNANPYYSSFYTTVENCTISDIDPGRYPIRIEYWDTGTLGEIKNVLCLCPSDYNITLLICPVGEYDTDDNAVNYTGNNRWRIGTVLQDSFCVAPNLDYFED